MPGNEWLDDEDGGDATTVEGEPLEVMLDQACQFCGERTVFNTIVTLRLPHFGKAMQTMYRCSSCGFRHSDVIMLENRGPTRCELYVDSSEALNSRVLRSNSGTIRVPEIGADIEPATASESFVSNVEGVLERICRVIRMVKSDSELDVYERCEAILRRLDRMKEGAEPFHMCIMTVHYDGCVDTAVEYVEESGISAFHDVEKECLDNKLLPQPQAAHLT